MGFLEEELLALCAFDLGFLEEPEELSALSGLDLGFLEEELSVAVSGFDFCFLIPASEDFPFVFLDFSRLLSLSTNSYSTS